MILQQLGLATALGALIGLERERKHQLEHSTNKDNDSFGGVRTFALISLAGALSYILSTYSIIFFVVVAVALLALIIASYVISGEKYGSLGITSEVASILVYIIGILCGMALFFDATTVAFIVLMLLMLKKPLHRWAKKIKFQELFSTMEFILIAFIVLPLLPNSNFGPYDFFNPYVIWLLVVFISGISFVSYVGIKLLGPKRGLNLTGFLTGFISTTALSVSVSNQSRVNSKANSSYLTAITIAISAMFLKMIFEVAVLNQELLIHVLIPLLAMSFTGCLISLLMMKRSEKEGNVLDKHVMGMQSPFSLMPALKFGALFALFLLVFKVAMASVGNNSVYLVSTIFGFFNVDAVTVSMSSLAKTEVTPDAAAIAIVLGGIVNTLLKIGIFFIFADKELAKKVSLVAILISFVGAVSLFFI
ncbi:MAG: MgtC/SapB family protein [Candidatus Peregrinibacteria bacterium]|nr:MgtC/SapB family protein [Candidatus Peregrinibacteria bacterium]